MGNRFEFFTPLMHKHEYKFIEKYLNRDDVLLEYGSGSGTIYFSGLVDKVISIEHDYHYFNLIKRVIDKYEIDNIDLYHVSGIPVKDQKLERSIAFSDYIKFAENFKFTKVLIDGRARKYCAEFISKIIDKDVIVFIHDFNYNNVEGYADDDYWSDILKNYDIFDIETNGQGIVALKKKSEKQPIIFETRNDLFKSFLKKQIIVEVGVFNGEFSNFIFNELKPKELHLIDYFEGVTHSGDQNGENVITIDLNDSYEKLLKKYKNKNVFIHKGKSTKILNQFNDNYFDIIYVDAGHDYSDVLNDLELSYKKIKSGGIICGHDFDNKLHIEVYFAVIKFCLNHNLNINYLTLDKLPSYGIIKN